MPSEVMSTLLMLEGFYGLYLLHTESLDSLDRRSAFLEMCIETNREQMAGHAADIMLWLGSQRGWA